MYHNIAPPPRGKRLSSLYTHPRAFQRQMSMLAKLGYEGLSLNKLYPYLKGERSGKVFGISFDDGYLDNYTNALPVLKRYNFSASCYIVSGAIGKTNAWTRNQNVQECDLMNVSQIQAWLEAGMSIGSHSHSHAHLCTLSPELLNQEIQQSKEVLEKLFQIPIEDFCFPYGEYNTQTLDALAQFGFRTGLSTQRGRASEKSAMLALPRVHMTKRTSLPLVLLKMFTAYEDNRTKESKP